MAPPCGLLPPATEFEVNVDSVTVSAPPSEKMAPPCGMPVPLPATVLPVNRLLATLIGTPLETPDMCSAPPTLMLATEALALLPLKVLPETVSCSPDAT